MPELSGRASVLSNAREQLKCEPTSETQKAVQKAVKRGHLSTSPYENSQVSDCCTHGSQDILCPSQLPASACHCSVPNYSAGLYFGFPFSLLRSRAARSFPSGPNLSSKPCYPYLDLLVGVHQPPGSLVMLPNQGHRT